MLQILPRSQGNVVGVTCSGKVTGQDYRDILLPTISRIIAEHGKARVLFDCDDNFMGYEAKALLEDMRYSFRHRHQLERFAVINGPGWLNLLTKACDKLTKCRCRTFHKAVREQAWLWIEE